MKFISGLILGTTLVFSSPLFAQEKTRSHLKCHLQLEDKTNIVHHFVNTKKDDQKFIDALTNQTVFMADGVTEKKIVDIYECVALNGRFKNKEARTLEDNTPF